MIGIVFATAEEARPLLVGRQTEQIGTVPFPVYRLTSVVRVIISGMGMEAARRACRELIGTHAVHEIINAGICGALDGGSDRGIVFGISSVVEAGQPDRVVTLSPDPAPGLEFRTLVTVLSPVFDPARRAALANVGSLVDMEGFAVADECSKARIPCCLIKGVTDFGDHQGRDDIRRHLGSVSERVAKHVLRRLGPLAPPAAITEAGI
jgi:nucleoside phosphorylase